MLLIFRLNKSTGTSATFVLGKNISFSKLVFKGWRADRGDNNAADDEGAAPQSNAALPVYLKCNLFDDSNVYYNSGRNTTINAVTDTGIGNMIPIGVIKEGEIQDFQHMDMVVIDKHTEYLSTKSITISINQVQINVVMPLNNNQAFGAIDNDAADPMIPGSGAVYDHGISFYFEASLATNQDIEQTVTIADST